MGIYDDDTEESNPGDLRKALEKANREKADLLAKLKDAEAKARRADITEVLQGLGLKPKVAKLIPSDVEPTKDAIEAWVKDYEDVFGALKTDASAPAATTVDSGEPEANTSDAPSVPDEYVAAMRAAQQTASTGLPLAPDPSGIAGKLAEAMGKNLSFEESVALINSLKRTPSN